MVDNQATFRFYAALTDLLAANVDSGRVVRRFEHSPSVKDQIEACGIPHTEVDLILANGLSVGFDYRLVDDDYVSVYPVFGSFDIAALTRVRPPPLPEMRFVVDVNLGKLARYLRLLGFDAVQDATLDDDDLVHISVDQGRVLLTKDRPLLKRAAITQGYLVRSIQPADQIVEVARRFDLAGAIEPFARCMACNGRIEPVSKADIDHVLEPLTRRYFEEFRRCSTCQRVFWRGSHHERLEAIIATVVESTAAPTSVHMPSSGCVGPTRQRG